MSFGHELDPLPLTPGDWTDIKNNSISLSDFDTGTGYSGTDFYNLLNEENMDPDEFKKYIEYALERAEIPLSMEEKY